MRVPKLRFPEFRDVGEWEKKKLGNYCEVLMCKRIFSEETNDKCGVPFYKIGTLGKVPDAFITEDIYLTYKSNYPFPRKGEILITCSGTVGKCIIYTGEEAYFQDSNIVWLDNPSNVITNDLLYYIIGNIDWKKLNSTTITRIYGSDLRNLLVVFPEDMAEQLRIAGCLSSLDKLITAHDKKLDALKLYKKGLMQQLFPAVGETVPKLRFPEFRNTGVWKEIQLQNICKMQAGKFVSATKISDIHNSNSFPCYGGNGQRGYTNTFTHSGKYPLIGRQGALCGNITLAKGKFHATEHAVVCTPQINISVDWLYFQLIKMNLNQYATGQAQPGLSVEVLEKISIKVPCTEIEQQKVADCLISLDNLIAAQINKIEALRTHKKGLLQQLFPAVEKTV